ncbi:uncharacterized protein TM35_000651050 [Trypanosoma theileri]|uniref:Uncharacterized protein n=1 Tax=Trypanosoma theileri TaxID=67003 RepID=A0A1X0NGF6_9TRYP|nr:uncharacterized protein TM35_000651050 [Trypanosoma theileri]ORC83543.1 hypothetical protein TM35_000651050 [Trypanosoma theileri]
MAMNKSRFLVSSFPSCIAKWQNIIVREDLNGNYGHFVGWQSVPNSTEHTQLSDHVSLLRGHLAVRERALHLQNARTRCQFNQYAIWHCLYMKDSSGFHGVGANLKVFFCGRKKNNVNLTWRCLHKVFVWFSQLVVSPDVGMVWAFCLFGYLHFPRGSLCKKRLPLRLGHDGVRGLLGRLKTPRGSPTPEGPFF